MLCSVGGGPGRGGRRQGDALLVHPLGLGAHDEAEEVLVRHGRPSDWRGRRGAALVVQAGPLVVESKEEKFSHSSILPLY